MKNSSGFDIDSICLKPFEKLSMIQNLEKTTIASSFFTLFAKSPILNKCIYTHSSFDLSLRHLNHDLMTMTLIRFIWLVNDIVYDIIKF